MAYDKAAEVQVRSELFEASPYVCVLRNDCGGERLLYSILSPSDLYAFVDGGPGPERAPAGEEHAHGELHAEEGDKDDHEVPRGDRNGHGERRQGEDGDGQLLDRNLMFATKIAFFDQKYFLQRVSRTSSIIAF